MPKTSEGWVRGRQYGKIALPTFAPPVFECAYCGRRAQEASALCYPAAINGGPPQ